MKTFTTLLALAAAVPAALAFPAYLNDPAKMAEVGDLLKRYEAAGQLDTLLNKRDPQTHFPVVVPGRKLIPDADHSFKAPQAGDIRGPCPGLNTMANHGYVSRDGVTSSQELAWAMQESFGLGPDLAEFLGILAVAVDGNPLTDRVTIGGPSSKVTNILGLPTPNGIGRHNAYEIDSSLTRNDKYFGDNFSMNGTLYENMFKNADKLNGGKLNILTQSAYRNQRYFESKRDNPEFSYVPVGVLFYGADHFPWRTLVSTNEDGTNVDATRESLASTYGAKSLGNGEWEYVPERFPAEWYRSSVPYTLPEIVSHAVLSLTYATTHGAALPTGFDPARVGDASYVACYISAAALAQVPSALNGIPVVSDMLNRAVAGFQQYNC